LRVPDSGNEMKVFNTSGHEVYHQTLDAASNHVDLSGQPSGLYIVRVNTPLGPVSRKLIIRK
jgi:hypothetical protein